MSVYTRDDEERIRLQAQVREWTRAGLLERAQGEALAAELHTELRRTNKALRLVFAFFTTTITASTVGLLVLFFQIKGEFGIAFMLALSAAGCWAAANTLASNQRLYRYGIEEAFAAGAALLLGLGAAFATAAVAPNENVFGNTAAMAGLLVTAAAAGLVYYRFGHELTAVAAIGLLAMVPFSWNVRLWLEHLVAAVLCAAAFAAAREWHRRSGDEYPGDDAALLEATAWIGIYLAFNLQLTMNFLGIGDLRPTERWFYWGTYVVVWLMPAAGLWTGIRDKDRMFIRINLAMALATLVTNKAYLGWPRYSWDPMILGVLLAGGALLVRRWLAAGPGGLRNGYTAERILEADRDAVSVLGTVSGALHPQTVSSHPREEPGFGGGRSGGGGATGSF